MDISLFLFSNDKKFHTKGVNSGVQYIDNSLWTNK